MAEQDWRPSGLGFESCWCHIVSELWQFHLPHFANWCLSDETLKAVGPFYPVFMPGEAKDPTHGVNV